MLQNELLGEVRRSDEEPAVEELTGLAAGTALILLGLDLGLLLKLQETTVSVPKTNPTL